MKGFDAAREVGSLVSRIRAAGLNFVARYYSYNQAKNLTPAEANALSAAGLKIVTVFESRGDRYENFNADQGARDAVAALRLAEQCGQPVGSAIYFAVDFDASPDQIDVGVHSYFQSVNQTINGRFKIGVYGSGLVCSELLRANLAAYSWLACAGGWRGTRGFSGWHIKQGLPSDPWHFGFSVDPDEGIAGDFGQWAVAAAVPVKVNPTDDPIEHIRAAQRLLGTDDDGDPGPETRRLAAAWRAKHAA